MPGPELPDRAPGGQPRPGAAADRDFADDRPTITMRAQTHQPLRARWDPTDPDNGRNRSPQREVRKRSAFGNFMATYGWRAYAIPVLIAVTALVGVDALRAPAEPEDKPAVAAQTTTPPATVATQEPTQPSSSAPIGVPPVPNTEEGAALLASLPSGALPDGGDFTEQGDGTWHVVEGSGDQAGEGKTRAFTYTVEVEDGVDTDALGGDDAFAAMVQATLSNTANGWAKDTKWAFQRVDSGTPDFRVSLTSQLTVRQMCGYDIELEVSCYNPGYGRVVLSEPRWVRGALDFQGDLGSYRQYQINHEVGHAMGFAQHQPCNADGALAPIMMQQTFGVANKDIYQLDPAGVVPNDDKTCKYNPWPYPGPV
jgi:hypothetical protein